jgi:hypothetical protein
MAGVTFELRGLRDLQGVLERASEVVRTSIARVNQDTAFAIQRLARGYAPRDRGDLINSIAVQGRDLTWRVGVLDVSIPSRGGRNAAHLNPSVYGVWYEYGFVHRKIQKRPFMGPAVDAERPRYDARIAQAAVEIERQAGRGA